MGLQGRSSSLCRFGGKGVSMQALTLERLVLAGRQSWHMHQLPG